MLVLINGASGTGKTTTAEILSSRINRAIWVHPDKMWDTTSMDSETILDLAVRQAASHGTASTVIIDCQIRPSSIAEVLSGTEWKIWMDVLLTCSREIREQRLLERGWGSTDFAVIDNWASVLHKEAISVGDFIIDTSNCSTEQVCSKIEQHFETGDYQ